MARCSERPPSVGGIVYLLRDASEAFCQLLQIKVDVLARDHPHQILGPDCYLIAQNGLHVGKVG